MKTLSSLFVILVLSGCAKNEEPASTATVSEPLPTVTATAPETIVTDTMATSTTATTATAPNPTTETATVVPAAAAKPSVPIPTTAATPRSATAQPAQPAASSTETTPAPAAPSPAPAPPVAVGGDSSQGATIVKARCAACHAVDGSGKTSMGTKYALRNWKSDAVQGQSDAELDRILREGEGRVSAGAHKSKALSKRDVENVIAYIRSLK